MKCTVSKKRWSLLLRRVSSTLLQSAEWFCWQTLMGEQKDFFYRDTLTCDVFVWTKRTFLLVAECYLLVQQEGKKWSVQQSRLSFRAASRKSVGSCPRGAREYSQCPTAPLLHTRGIQIVLSFVHTHRLKSTAEPFSLKGGPTTSSNDTTVRFDPSWQKYWLSPFHRFPRFC